MNAQFIAAATVGAVAIGAIAIAHAQQRAVPAQNIDVGKSEYDAHCAQCHGLNGKGHGPYVPVLSAGTVLPDLTMLAKNNNGVFPVQHIVETIDGRAPVGAHGPKDMPIWGQIYKAQSPGVNPNYNPDAFVRVKILFLTEYIYRLQAK